MHDIAVVLLLLPTAELQPFNSRAWNTPLESWENCIIPWLTKCAQWVPVEFANKEAALGSPPFCLGGLQHSPPGFTPLCNLYT